MAGAERSSDHPRMLIGLSDRHCFEPSAGIAVRSIQNAPQIWPSGSAMSRPYMEPCSCTGLMSAVPPFAAAAAFIASTDSRLSQDRLSATSRSEEHTSELQSQMRISYAAFCFQKKKQQLSHHNIVENDTQ